MLQRSFSSRELERKTMSQQGLLAIISTNFRQIRQRTNIVKPIHAVAQRAAAALWSPYCSLLSPALQSNIGNSDLRIFPLCYRLARPAKEYMDCDTERTLDENGQGSVAFLQLWFPFFSSPAHSFRVMPRRLKSSPVF